MKKLGLVVSVAALISGCNSMPDRLAVPEQVSLLPFSDTVEVKSVVEGQQARWGGRIAQIENRSDSTVLEIVHFSLNGSGRPIESDKTLGRFRVYVDGFIDPDIYKPGRLVTVLGHVGEREQGRIGSYRFQVVTLLSKEVYLWAEEKKKETEVRYIPYVIHTPIYRVHH